MRDLSAYFEGAALAHATVRLLASIALCGEGLRHAATFQEAHA